MSNTPIGISGLAVYAPPFRVDLQAWCAWTGENPAKIRDVVGSGFRLPGPQQSVYTMAANAILRLIVQFDINPAEVRFLALGTESSTDNSAGAVIIKGMVDDALRQLGKEPLSRNCEVPEFKHACLGGIYALKNALRFINTDGHDAKAIVVCSDIALYATGSSGEPTQGAGAVAILLEANPTIASIDLHHAGCASDYRGVDFRKPIQYRNGDGREHACSNVPVFNGRYSASCYIDEMWQALEDMCRRRAINVHTYLNNVDAVFMHRPFRRMPENGWGMAYLFGLAADESGHNELRNYCEAAGVDFQDALRESLERPNVADYGVRERIGEEVFPVLTTVLRQFRQQPNYQQYIVNRMALGTAWMEELGNLYTGALPAWLAAGLEEAATTGAAKAGQEILLVGYGSGDAAEAIPIRLVTGWQQQAVKIDMRSAMANAVNLTHEQYLTLRNGSPAGPPPYTPKAEFIVDRVGLQSEEGFQDAGIEYYRFIH
jgi:hydroxymethylglutaryl-CoA synthase